MDGILIIDKPEGITSHDVVSRCRKILRTKRIGHTGTLDPFATGVVVILVGKATRLAQFLDKDAKEYEAVVRLGFETDTGDRTGRRKEEEEKRRRRGEEEIFSVEEIENVLKNFRGEIWQTPPMYSAKKVAGKKLYELARKGVEIERKPVKVSVYKLEILPQRHRDAEISEEDFLNLKLETWNLKLKVLCSAGTYIRTLAEDIGKKLGVGAHLAELRRTKAGKFSVETAVSLEELEKIIAEKNLETILISMNEAVSHLAEIRLSEKEIAKIKNGAKVKRDLPEMKNESHVRLTDDRENLLAIGVYDESERTVQPKLVLV